MGKTTYSMEFNQPVEHVFSVLNDADAAPQWISNLESIEALTGGGNRVGAKSRHIYNENGRTIEMIEETLVYEPNKRVKIYGKTDGFELTVDYTLHPSPNGTRIDYESETRMTSWFMKLLAPLINHSTKTRIEDDFSRLKNLVENSSTLQPTSS